MEPENPLLDCFLLQLADLDTPKVCFVPTASGDADSYIVKFYEAFGNGRSIPTHLPLFRRRIDDLRALVFDQDIIYVGGGNTANMLAAWRVHGLDVILREAWQRGVILAGLSAGSVCWFEAGVTDSFGKQLQSLKGCLGLLPGSHCPHYDGESQRRPSYRRLVAEGELSAGIAADDGVGLVYRGTDLVDVVSSRKHARAWRVLSRDGAAVEEEIVPRYLGG